MALALATGMRLGIATLVFAITSCGGSSTPVSNQQIGVSVLVNGTGIRVLETYDAATTRAVTPLQGPRLRFELQNDVGEVLLSGVVNDPRALHSELDIDGDGQLDREDIAIEFGVAHLRLPLLAGTLVLFEVANNRLVELGRTEYAPPADIADLSAGVGVKRQGITICDVIPGQQRCTPELLFGSGSSSNVDILVVGDGFTETEIGGFRDQARGLGEALFSLRDYDEYKDKFNVWALPLVSADSGIDDADADIDAANIFGLSFGTGSRPRRCIFPDGNGIALAESVRKITGAEVIALLGNTTEHGGCASGSLFTSSLSGDFHRTVAHELGHAVYGLADEYDYGDCREPNSPNVSSSADDPPWADVVNTAVPSLTAEEAEEVDSEARTELIDEAHGGTVGAYEGASYCATDAYRPSYTCRMRERLDGETEEFCPVCRKEFEDSLESFSGDDSCPQRWRNDGICDPCLSDDPDCCTRTERHYLIFTKQVECDEGCGDGVCSGDEDLTSCPFDCAVAQNICGDGQCNGDETDANCGQDCGCGATDSRTDVAPLGCFCDDSCIDSGDCCADSCAVYDVCDN